jgi:hypothetical protein
VIRDSDPGFVANKLNVNAIKICFLFHQDGSKLYKKPPAFKEKKQFFFFFFFGGLPGSGAGSATLGQTPVLSAEPDADQNSDFYLMRIRIRNFI